MVLIIVASCKAKKKRDKRKKKKRQGSRTGTKAVRTKSAIGRIPAATPYETSPLQAFCKPMAVLTNKPEKSRPKYNPAHSGGWAPNMSIGPPDSSASRGHTGPSTNHHSTADLRISPRKSIDNGALRKSFNNGSKDYDDSTVHKLIKVFLSEKQSGILKELGMEFPCAPPATPTPGMYSICSSYHQMLKLMQ